MVLGGSQTKLGSKAALNYCTTAEEILCNRIESSQTSMLL